MSGFPWDTFITAVVPAAGVLAGAALSGRQTSVASRTADLKRDYAAVVTAATALMEYRRPRTAPRSHWSADAALRDEALADAVQLACAVIDLAGSPYAADAAYFLSRAAAEYADAAEIRKRLDRFLSVARREVGGRPGIRARARMGWRRIRP